MSIESVMPSNHLILCRPFSSCPQSFPASGSFPMSWLFTSGGWSTGVSASASVLSMNIQSFQGKIIQWMISFRIDWFDLLAVQASLIQHNSPLWDTQKAQHNVPGLLWVKHRVSGPLPYSAPCKDKSVAVQAMFEAAFSYTTFSCKSLYCMLEKGSPIKDRRDNVCCGWQYQIAVKL